MRFLRPGMIVLIACAVSMATGADAFAHASDRGFVLLMPTTYYLAGGAIAVAVSFLVLTILPPSTVAVMAAWRLPLIRFSDSGRLWTSWFSLALLAVVVAAGFWGSRDPLSNPLPLVIWTLFWIGVTFVQGIFGNVWAWINPWYGAWRLLRFRDDPPLAYRWGYWPAVALFSAFSWFELVYPAPDDPWRLALVVSIYWLLNFFCSLLFGYDSWMRHGECFSTLFAMISRLSVFSYRESVDQRGKSKLALCCPGAKLATAEPLPPGGVFLLLLALSSVSFDGLSRTFFWLGVNGVNPLEFPGRSALIPLSTGGLLLMFTLLSAAFYGTTSLGIHLSGTVTSTRRLAGLLIWSIAPIALAYHVAHYLTALLVNGQYALVALSDPFGQGWNLFGTADWQVSAGIVMGAESAWVLWNIQAAAIIGGHVVAVLAAHVIAQRVFVSHRAAFLSQIPMTGLMVGYTVFGLWLLSTPTAS